MKIFKIVVPAVILFVMICGCGKQPKPTRAVREPMFFIDQYGKPVDAKYEQGERADLFAIIPAGAQVLELGARLGTTSCTIRQKIGHNGNLVLIEPDRSVIPALQQNLSHNNCAASLFVGVIGVKDLRFHQTNAANAHLVPEQGCHDEKDGGSFYTVPAITFSELEKKYQVKFDTLIADCEGCVEETLSQIQQTGQLGRFKMIWYEADGEMSDYMRINEMLTKAGFTLNTSSGFVTWKK